MGLDHRLLWLALVCEDEIAPVRRAQSRLLVEAFFSEECRRIDRAEGASMDLGMVIQTAQVRLQALRITACDLVRFVEQEQIGNLDLLHQQFLQRAALVPLQEVHTF